MVSTASPAPPAPRTRLGEWLRAERVRLGFSYAEVERDTHINRAYLEALEGEHYDALPAPVYTRGFVRLYARRLGIDPAVAVALLPEALPIPPGLEPSAALRRHGRESPAIALPRLPSMRVPSLRVPEMRDPRPGLRLPSVPSGRVRLPGGSVSPEARRWGLAGLGVGILLLAAMFLPRYFDAAGDTTGTGGTTTSATAQATVQAQGGGAGGAVQPQATLAVGPTTGTAAGAPAGRPVANLAGLTRADAQARLGEAGLTSVVVEIASATVPQGQVMSQQPAAGTPVNPGDNVTLIISRGAPRN